MVKLEGLDSLAADQDPFIPDAGPVIKDLSSIDYQRAIFRYLSRGRFEVPGNPFLAAHIHHQRSTLDKAVM
jgi:hypothetical protein